MPGFAGISIHALLAESDSRRWRWSRRFWISIHALLAESDPWMPARQRQGLDFYPRSPCGERRGIKVTMREPAQFLSTLSLRRATGINPNQSGKTDISIHALLAESDVVHIAQDPSPGHFYPRSPCGERPQWYNVVSQLQYFYPRSPCGERPAT